MDKRKFHLWYSEEAERKQIGLHMENYEPSIATLESGKKVWYSFCAPIDSYDRKSFEKNSTRPDLQYLGIGELEYEKKRTGGIYG